MALMTQVGLEFIARNRANRQISTFTRSIQRMGRQMLAIAGVGGGLYAVKRGFDYIIKAAMKQEDAVFLLGAALKTAGEYSAETMTKFEAFAASIQKVTIYGDEEVLALMQLMKSLGVTSAALEQATRMSIGLAAATGRDVRSMAMYVALAQQGEFTMLRRYIPALRKTTDATEQLQIVTDFAASGFKIAEAQAQTASGSWAQLKNELSDLAEIIGGPVADAMAQSTRETTKYLSGHKAGFERYIEDIKEGTDIWWNFWKAVAGKTPAGLIIDKLRGVGTPIAKPVADKYDYMTTFPPVKKPELPVWVKETVQREKEVGEIAKKYLPALRTEIALTGKLGDAREHARQVMKLENELREKGLEQSAEGIRLMERQAYWLKELEMAQRLAKVADSIGDAFGTAFEGIIFEAEKLRDVLRALMRDIAMAVMRQMVIQPIALGISGAIRGGFGAMFGGGAAATQSAFSSPHGGPALQYGGEVEKTGWAKVHKGETYSGVGGGGVQIIIQNNSPVPLQQGREPYFDGDDIVIQIEAALNDRIHRGAGPLKGTIQGLK